MSKSFREEPTESARVSVCTIVAGNYIAFARVLMKHVAKLHPDWLLTILTLDSSPSTTAAVAGDMAQSVARNWGLNEIGLDPGDESVFPMIYDVTELATAVKPWLLKALLREGAQAVLYLDPDILPCAPLEPLATLARTSGIVLTPHVLGPLPRDGMHPDETDIMHAGIYNLGFIAVGPQAGEFLDWWSARLKRECRNDPSSARFVDQRWVDFAPALFAAHILRDKAYNVAYWNLHERSVRRDELGTYSVGDEPLRFFHFSGFDPFKPWLLSKHLGPNPRILLTQEPDLAELCAGYAQRLFSEGFAEAHKAGYKLARTPQGLEVDSSLRRMFLEELIAAEAAGDPSPPSPFAEGGEELFRKWLRSKKSVGPHAGMSRGLVWMYEKWCQKNRLQGTDPGEAFPAFQKWLRSDGVKKPLVPLELIPEISDAKVNSDLMKESVPRTPGYTVVGYLNAELGLGEAARLLVRGMRASGVPFSTVTCTDIPSRQNHEFVEGDQDTRHGINVMCVTADALPAFHKRMGPSFFHGAYNIGLWFWELEKTPARMKRAAQLVDEVWVASRFIEQSIEALGTVPVHTFPLPIVERTLDPDITRAKLGLPEDRFVFLFAYDYNSVFERKNPIGLIKAFSQAFQPGEGPLLVLKSINGDRYAAEKERLLWEASKHPDVLVIDQYVSAGESAAFVGLCDCYCSLHRAEGFGLGMAEAMSFGKPVIATGYSGNCEFMNEDNSFLCNYRLVPVGPGHTPYPAGARWAEPDTAHAAELMKRVYQNREEARERGARAQADIRKNHSPEVTARFLKERFEAIQFLEPRRSSAAASQLAVDDALGRLRTVLDEVSKELSGAKKPRKWGDRIVARLIRREAERVQRVNVALCKTLERLARDTAQQQKLLERRLEELEDRLPDDETARD